MAGLPRLLPAQSFLSARRSEVRLCFLGSCPAVLSQGGVGYPREKLGVGVSTYAPPLRSSLSDVVEQGALLGALCALSLPPRPHNYCKLNNLLECVRLLGGREIWPPWIEQKREF